MGILAEFKTFAMRGNVVDLAVGVVIGGAFGAIVTSLVGDVLMPLIGVVTGGIDFSQAAMVLKEGDEAAKVAPVLLSYGKLVQATFNFIIVAFAIFLLVKAMNAAKKEEVAPPAPPPGPSNEEKLLMEIRDALRNR